MEEYYKIAEEASKCASTQDLNTTTEQEPECNHKEVEEDDDYVVCLECGVILQEHELVFSYRPDCMRERRKNIDNRVKYFRHCILKYENKHECSLPGEVITQFEELVNLYDWYRYEYRTEADTRKYFLNTQYVLFQLLKMNKHPCRIEDFKIIKNVQSLHFHDRVCGDLFEKLGWKFTPIMKDPSSEDPK